MHSARKWVQEAKGGEEQDPCVGGDFCSLLNGWKKELDKESVCKMVHCKLILVALLRESHICRHDSGVADEDIESRIVGEKFLGSCLDRGKRQLVAFDEDQLSKGTDSFHRIDELLSSLGVTAGEVDVFGRMSSQRKDGLLAKAIGT